MEAPSRPLAVRSSWVCSLGSKQKTGTTRAALLANCRPGWSSTLRSLLNQTCAMLCSLSPNLALLGHKTIFCINPTYLGHGSWHAQIQIAELHMNQPLMHSRIQAGSMNMVGWMCVSSGWSPAQCCQLAVPRFLTDLPPLAHSHGLLWPADVCPAGRTVPCS